jgi:hypothetical protein
VAAAWFGAVWDEHVIDPITFSLAACIVVSNLLAVRYRGRLWLAPSFTFSMLAVAFQGPAAAFLVAIVGEVGSWAVERYSLRAFTVNALGAGVPNLAAGVLFAALLPPDETAWQVAVVLTAVGFVALGLNLLIVGALTRSLATCASADLRRELAAPIVWNVVFTVTLAVGFYARPMLAVLAGVLVAVGFSSMVRLRRRSEQDRVEHETGVLEAVVGTLKQRDTVAARHAAAVAAYARDIAQQLDLDARRCNQAHIAGLLHDVGKLGLGDRVSAHDRTLSIDEWRAVRRHPEVGAALLRGLGDVSEAVLYHHERVDGRGYPRGLHGEEIPILARILSVAEVYDTLTGGHEPGRRGSLEALLELRRVAGSQLDGPCVEALAAVLAGQPDAYRRATTVDIDDALAQHVAPLQLPDSPASSERMA